MKRESRIKRWLWWKPRGIVRSFRRPAGWTLIPERPRHTSTFHRIVLGGRTIHGHFTPYDWRWWLHPLRAWVYRKERAIHRAAWERQWGGDPSCRRIVDGLPRLEACAKALTSHRPRLWLIAREIDDELAARGEHEGMGLSR